jgi:hypothetical protein
VFEAPEELQPGPVLAKGRDFHVDQARRQQDLAQTVSVMSLSWPAARRGHAIHNMLDDSSVPAR